MKGAIAAVCLAALAASPAARALTREEAAIRSRQVGRVSYGLWFSVDATSADFQGRAVVQFELKPKADEYSKTIFLEFEGGAIREMRVNGSRMEVDADHYDGRRLTFKVGELQKGANRLELAFEHPYSDTGNGLDRFKDPVDGRTYLYTNFEPDFARLVYPCFDQPDLKASFELTVEAPASWQVVSNTMERQKSLQGDRGDRRAWAFPPSPLISTYLFAMHAGPYKEWHAQADGIPMRLFARQSLAQFVDAKAWFDVTRKGLAFYSLEFGYPYPYSKYDQVIVPQFNAGAMENPGAVTFSEHYVYRSRVTEDTLMGRADTILHEMAHHWFGDLVTMRWWNGLWLNESFATFMSADALDRAMHSDSAWQELYGEKQWAYWEDQLVTTHPIDVAILDTDQAHSNFDGITYGKGAASLKQLKHLVGDDGFREGLQRYFQRFALRNTSIADFIQMISEASDHNLSGWEKSWLQTSGVNTLRADWACTGGRISSFELVQGPSEGNGLLRPHRTEVALYRGPALRKEKTFSVAYSKDRTPVPEAIGEYCPNFVYPNDGDFDYVKVELDPVSLKTAERALRHLGGDGDEGAFARQMVWQSLWEMVVDAKLKAQDFIDVALKHAGSEKSTLVLSQNLRRLVSPSADRESALRYVDDALRPEYAKKLERFARWHMGVATAGSDLQLAWFHGFLGAAATKSASSFLRGVLAGKAKLKGLDLSQDRRWEIVEAVARIGLPNTKTIEGLISDELDSDKTEQGQMHAIAAEASIPDAAVKTHWLGRILASVGSSLPALGPTPAPSASPSASPSSGASPTPSPSPSWAVADGPLPISKMRQAMGAFHLLGQEELSLQAADAFFEALPHLARNAKPRVDEEMTWGFARSMFPPLCDQAVVDRAGAALASLQNLPAPVVKSLRVHQQEEQRCVRAREASAQK